MNIEGQVGKRKVADGTENIIRTTQTAEIGVSDIHGRYQEACARDYLYTVNAKTITLAATHVAPLTAATGTPIVGLYNPTNSAKSLAILKIGISSISGTPGGPFYIDLIAANAGITNFNATNPMSNSTAATAGSIAKNLTNTAITGGLVGITLRPLGGPAAIAAGAGMYNIDEEVAGAIIIKPGMAIAITCHAAGTTHIVSGYITYEEVDLLA